MCFNAFGKIVLYKIVSCNLNCFKNRYVKSKSANQTDSTIESIGFLKEKKSLKLKACYFSGIPVIIVGVAASIHPEGYGTIKS